MNNRRTFARPKRLLLTGIILTAVATIILLFFAVRGILFPEVKISDNFGPVISADGRFVAFSSYDRELLGEDQSSCENELLCWNVFVRDRATGELLLASSDSQGKPAARGSGAIGSGGGISPFGNRPSSLAISDDGRYVAFASSALNSDHDAVLFRKDMKSGELLTVSQPASGGPVRATFYEAAMSGDGRFIVYWTHSPEDLRAGKGASLYLRDMTAEKPELIPTGNFAMPASVPNPVAISADGRYIVYAAAFSLARDGAYPPPGVFVKDRQTGALRTISAPSSGEQANGPSQGASISADGRYAVFASSATNLVSEQTCPSISSSCTNVFLKDLETGETRLLSKTETGASMNNAGSPVISQDGRSAAFVTLSASQREPGSLPPPSVNETIYSGDLVSGGVMPAVKESGDLSYLSKKARSGQGGYPFGEGEVQVSQGMAGGQGISISSDGRFIAFPAFPSWIGESDRKCEHSYTNEMGLKGTYSEPCIDIFVTDISSRELSRMSAAAESS